MIPPKPQSFHSRDRSLYSDCPLVPFSNICGSVEKNTLSQTNTQKNTLRQNWVKWICRSPFILLIITNSMQLYYFLAFIILFRRIPVDQHVLICMFVVYTCLSVLRFRSWLHCFLQAWAYGKTLKRYSPETSLLSACCDHAR